MKNFSIVLILMFLGLTSCSNNVNLKSDEVVMHVAANKVDCVGAAPMKCLQVKEGNEDNWSYFYDDIKGFNFEEGYEYELIVKRKQKPEPIPADATSVDYTLIKEVKKVKK